MFECDNRASRYSDDETSLNQEIFQDGSSMPTLNIDALPRWSVHPYEVEFDAVSSTARCSYGSVHRSIWNGTSVVIKLPFMADEKRREMVLNETEIWIKL